MLRYLFTAEMRDGTVVRQGPEDRSEKHPGGSAYADVDPSAVRRFTLTGEGRSLTVDLDDGSFIYDGGLPIYTFSGAVTDRAVIYFRRITISYNSVGAEVGRKIVYNVGWRGINDGREIRHTMVMG